MRFHYSELFSTYSIVAYDPETGQLGGAVQTHQMGVGRLLPVAQPGVGVIASQSLINVSFGTLGLAMLREGIAPEHIVNGLTASDPGASRRQLAVINAQGEAAAFTGEGCIREAGHHAGENYSVQANMMTRTTVIDAMREAYESAYGDLATRMVAALQAAQDEDGDIRGMQSAALIVVPGTHQPDWASVYDLRVDEHENPVQEMARLVRIRHAQLLDTQGHTLLNEGKMDQALQVWQQARAMAPEQEEVAFWQAVTLADSNPRDDAVSIAAEILASALSREHRRQHWLDLIQRLDECGLIERKDAARDLLGML
jgi:uncharacterized Ntn-hydrolase superfamily protein